MNIMRVDQVNTVSTKVFGLGEFLEENLGIAGFVVRALGAGPDDADLARR